MKGYSEKKLRDLFKEKEKQLKSLDIQAEDLKNKLEACKHTKSPIASIPEKTEKDLKKALGTINKKREALMFVINCVKDNLNEIDEAKIQYKKTYINKYNDSMFMLEKIKI